MSDPQGESCKSSNPQSESCKSLDPQGESCKSLDPQGESCKSLDPQGESCKSSQYLDKHFEAKILENLAKQKPSELFQQKIILATSTDTVSKKLFKEQFSCNTKTPPIEKTEELVDNSSPTMERTGIVLLFGCVLVLFVIVLILVYIISYERSQVWQVNPSYTSYNRDHSVNLELNTNRLFTANEDVDFVIISLEKRIPTHFEVLKKDFAREGISVTLFKGINGKELKVEDYTMTPQYRAFFLNNQKEFAAGSTKTNYMGHLGATLSHLEVLKNVKNMTVICEDDIDIHTNFRIKFQDAIAAVTKLDPNWDILLLGYTANYNDYHFHKRNDRYPIYEGGIVKIDSWIGGWAYVVRNETVAKKIVKLLTTPALSWHCDLRISEENRNGNLNAYACMPTICDHAGSLRISSWDFTQTGKWATIKSDTNL